MSFLCVQDLSRFPFNKTVVYGFRLGSCLLQTDGQNMFQGNGFGYAKFGIGSYDYYEKHNYQHSFGGLQFYQRSFF